ncbi:MAG TPA: hypothetical protein QF753_02775 [Victivallales bacterium]|jgi:hypothetical protein|nr:hypothetical protein [Victivallales bacterium]|tara:strand:+ start:1262 stop:1597 length:336 start_codon:yes stop_codon:yes gene_type:complete
MITTFCSFAITGVIFLILYFLKINTWQYYLPSTLIIMTIWCKIIHLSWKEHGIELVSSFARQEGPASAGWLLVLSILTIILGFIYWNLIAIIISVISLIVSITLDYRKFKI